MKNILAKPSFEAFLMFAVLSLIAAMLFFGVLNPAHALETTILQPEDAPDEVPNGDNLDIRSAILSIVNWILTFLGLIAVLLIIYAGFLFIFSQGDEKQISKAKQIIIYVGIGIIVILLSYAIVQLFVSVKAPLEEAGGGGGDDDLDL